MVGALADWFAVTALFRHPLGIPIPHTAIIPRRKDQIGRSLGEFVQGNFLTHEVLTERLAGVHVGQRLGRWLREPAHAERAADAVDRRDARHDRGARRPRRAGRHRRPRRAAAAGDRRSPRCSAGPIDVAVEGGHHQRLLDAVLTGVCRRSSTTTGRTLRARASTRSRRGGCPSRSTTASSTRSSAASSASSPTSRADPNHEVRGVDRRAHPSARRAAAQRPGADRQGRGGQARAARPPRRAGVAAVAVGRAQAGDARRPPTTRESELRRRLTDRAGPGRRAARRSTRSCRRRSTAGSSGSPATSSTTTAARSPT